MKKSSFHYFNSTAVPAPGDLIATGKTGHCRVTGITMEKELSCRNTHTGEDFTVFADDCDLLERVQIQKVIFRAERTKAAHVTAVIVGQPGSPSAPLMVWDAQSGHGNGSWNWYQSTRPATEAQYRFSLSILRRQYAPEYVIQVVQRYTRKDRDALHAQFNAPATK